MVRCTGGGALCAHVHTQCVCNSHGHTLVCVCLRLVYVWMMWRRAQHAHFFARRTLCSFILALAYPRSSQRASSWVSESGP